MTFLPNGAAEEEENDSDEHEEEDEEEISIYGDVAVYLYQVNIAKYQMFSYKITFWFQEYCNKWAGVCVRELCDLIEVQDLVPEQQNRGQDVGLWSRLWKEVQIPRLMGMGTARSRAYSKFWPEFFQGICDILVPGEFINDDTLTIICEMTLPGNDVTKLGYTYNAEVVKEI